MRSRRGGGGTKIRVDNVHYELTEDDLRVSIRAHPHQRIAVTEP